jgi:murein DD-endopeptidase MepM/ murein hydrolase activator NlpD
VNGKRRQVTFIVHADGALESHTYRVPLAAARAVAITLGAIALLMLLGIALYGPIYRTAARVPGLRREIVRLRAENAQVHQLARRLEQVEARYEQVRGMLGGNIVPRRTPELAVAYPVVAQVPGARAPYETGPSLPTHWPLDEEWVVTREQISASPGGEAHPGLDVAVPMGTPIRAAGGGVVAEAGSDVEYGRFVLINHPEGYQTMYGHTSRILVSAGEEVRAGQVIGLSGSTGRSTAPHLHFETRRAGRPIDPRTLLSRES